VDLAFLSSNLLKVPSGGWFPLLFAFLVFTIMFIWYKGEKVLHDKIRKDQAPFEELVEQLKSGKIGRCDGVGIFMSAVEEGVPSAMTQFLTHMPVLPETTVFLTLKRKHSPYVPLSKSRVKVLPDGCIRVVLETGFMENKVSIEELSDVTHMHGIGVSIENATFFLGNEQVAPSKNSWLGKRLVVDLYNLLLQYSHSSTAATFRIPPKNVVYIGSHYSFLHHEVLGGSEIIYSGLSSACFCSDNNLLAVIIPKFAIPIIASFCIACILSGSVSFMFFLNSFLT